MLDKISFFQRKKHHSLCQGGCSDLYFHEILVEAQVSTTFSDSLMIFIETYFLLSTRLGTEYIAFSEIESLPSQSIPFSAETLKISK